MYIIDFPDHMSKLIKQSSSSLQIGGRTYFTLLAGRIN